MGMWTQSLSAWHRQSEGGGFFETVKQTFDLTSLAPDLLGRVQQHREQIVSLDMFRKTDAAARKLLHGANDNIIRIIEDIGQFQHASETMQGYLVAMPEYRNLYNQNMAAGYENGYSKVDKYRGSAYMHTDANYRDITSGMSTEYDEKIWNWVTDEARVNRPDIFDKQIIQMNWRTMRDFDWEDADPCSQLNASC